MAAQTSSAPDNASPRHDPTEAFYNAEGDQESVILNLGDRAKTIIVNDTTQSIVLLNKLTETGRGREDGDFSHEDQSTQDNIKTGWGIHVAATTDGQRGKDGNTISLRTADGAPSDEIVSLLKIAAEGGPDGSKADINLRLGTIRLDGETPYLEIQVDGKWSTDVLRLEGQIAVDAASAAGIEMPAGSSGNSLTNPADETADSEQESEMARSALRIVDKEDRGRESKEESKMSTDDQGNVQYVGTSESDTYTSGRGNDYLEGGDGDDTLTGGIGNDDIVGGKGDDMLAGDSRDATISVADLITMQEARDVTVTFDYEEAGYRNTLGVYKVDPETGEIRDVEILWENASLKGSGGDLEGGVSSKTIAADAGDQIGFFIIGDGFSANKFSQFENGRFEFRNAEGEVATVDDAGARLYFVDEGGTATALNNPTYHTAAYGERSKLNSDGIPHTVGYAQSAEGTIQLGFEDLYKGGDKDYDDAVFTVDVGESTAKVLNAHFQQNLVEETENLEVRNVHSKLNVDQTADRIQGQEGADVINGMQGNDLLAGGGVGNEWVFEGGEWVYKGVSPDADKGLKDKSDDLIYGGSGKDVLLGDAGRDQLHGGDGDDTINAGDDDDLAYGDAGNDTINLEDGDDWGYGGDGDDVINAGAGNDTVYGGDGNDSLRGGTGDDALHSEGGDDEVFGGEGDDTIYAASGADKVFGGDGNDTTRAGSGDDHVEGGAGNDDIVGGSGADMLLGGSGKDTLSGGSSADKLVGGTGEDIIKGGAGDDHMWGGEWAGDNARDTYLFDPGSGKDMIHDFEVGKDMIDLSAYNVSWEDIQKSMTDEGWATSIDLSSLGGEAGDQIILVNVSKDDLSDESFNLAS